VSKTAVKAMANNKRSVKRRKTPIVNIASQEFLLDMIREINDYGSLARFTIHKHGLYPPCELPLSYARIRESLNALEAAGKVRVYRRRKDRWNLFALVSDQAPDGLVGDFPFWPHEELESPEEGDATE
jgi:DNA-binding transcriptional ArsR family regulator